MVSGSGYVYTEEYGQMQAPLLGPEGTQASLQLAVLEFH